MAQHSFLQNLLNGQALEWQTLGEVLVRTKGTKITAGKMKELHKKDAPIKIFAGGKTFALVDFDDIPQKDINHKPSIIVKSRGIIEFEYYDKPFSHKNEMWAYHSQNPNINIKFIYYFLKQNEPYFQQIGSKMQMPQIATPDTDKFQIPILPLSVQSQIVQILDTFTELNDQLTAELSMRQKQYQYYRNKLLTFDFEAVQSLATASDSERQRATASDSGWHWYGRLWVRFLVNLGVGNQSIDLEMMKGYMEEAFHSFKLVILGVRQRKSKPITKHIAILVWLKVNYGKKIHYVSP